MFRLPNLVKKKEKKKNRINPRIYSQAIFLENRSIFFRRYNNFSIYTFVMYFYIREIFFNKKQKVTDAI